jgi:uncharacterized PurR-regulated membrane protein YhhQ (DUF165 family)
MNEGLVTQNHLTLVAYSVFGNSAAAAALLIIRRLVCNDCCNPVFGNSAAAAVCFASKGLVILIAVKPCVLKFSSSFSAVYQ